MARSNAKTVAEYLKELPADRRAVVSTVRDLVKKNLPKGYEETMLWGMISYVVPLERLPDTYNQQPLCYASLAAQKNYYALYLMSAYTSPQAGKSFREAYEATGKKLDMGQSCVRFKRAEDLPLHVIGDTIASIGMDEYVAELRGVDAKRKTRPRPAAKKKIAAKKKAAAKKTARRR